MAAMCFRISSGCRAGAWPASGETRQPQRLPYKQHAIATVVKRGSAERVREDSAAKSIRRTKMRRAGRCRITAAQRLPTNTQRTRPPERENSHHRISRHCVPNLLFSQKRQRAGLCSTARARIVPLASQAWSETGTRFAPCASPRPLPRTRNDSRPRSMSRSQSQHPRDA